MSEKRKYQVSYKVKTTDSKTYKGKAEIENCYSELHAKSKCEDHLKNKLGKRYKSIEFGEIGIETNIGFIPSGFEGLMDILKGK